MVQRKSLLGALSNWNISVDKVLNRFKALDDVKITFDSFNSIMLFLEAKRLRINAFLVKGNYASISTVHGFEPISGV